MKRTLEEIRQMKSYLTDNFYNGLRGEQEVDDSFYKDTFAVPQLEDLIVQSRTGGGAELIDVPIAQISSGRMFVTRKNRKDTEIE